MTARTAARSWRASCPACAIGCSWPVDASRRRPATGPKVSRAATASGFSSRDLQQDRHELVDLAHLVEEVIRARRHAALAYRRQIVIGEHDDPHVAATRNV